MTQPPLTDANVHQSMQEFFLVRCTNVHKPRHHCLNQYPDPNPAALLSEPNTHVFLHLAIAHTETGGLE